MPSRKVTFEQAVCGVPTSVLFLGIGIASLLISLQDRKENPGDPDCGQAGSPPLRDYLFGTGISFLIICLSFLLTTRGSNFPLLSWILGVSNVFLFCWIIVGCVSLWRDGQDCKDSNPRVYKMGMAAVITSMFMCCCGGFTSFYVAAGQSDEEDEQV